MIRALLAAAMLVAPLAAMPAEYMEKTPFQLSRAFSPGVITEGGRIVWVAGQTATRGSQNADISNNFEAQVRQVFSQIDQIMKRAGGSLANLVTMTVSSRSRATASASSRCARTCSRTATTRAARSSP